MRSLVLYPDPILKKRAAAIADITPEIKELGGRMAETLQKYQGVGLAGPQVGVSLRVIVVQDGDKAIVCVNPEITRQSKETAIEEEGCLSIPTIFLLIRRPVSITVTYRDLNGERVKRNVTGLTARIFQHEIDHLNGILIINRVGIWKRWKLRAQLKNIHG